MSAPTDPHRPDDALEAYLDSRLAEGDSATTAPLNGQAVDRRQLALQEQVDARLAQLFRFEAPAQHDVVAMLGGANARADLSSAVARQPGVRLWWSAAAVALAAAIGWVLLAAGEFSPPRKAPLFAAKPLAEVYRDTVSNGFEPYYECREADRFADTFARRQGQPLELAPLPLGSSMLGLSYPGGLSRDTTAMLGRVDDKPVMVFVDRAESDQPIAADQTADSLHVFREERDGLVFYEVTPLAEPRLMRYLVPPSSSPTLPPQG